METWRLAPAIALLLIGAPFASGADLVTPSERVRSAVVVREAPARGSRAIGRLAKGEDAELLGSVEDWHRIALSDDRAGFVSAAWTRVVPVEAEVASPPPPPLPELLPLPRPSLLQRMANSLAGVFGRTAPIELQVHEPETRELFLRHPTARLPVSGIAAAAGDGGLIELVLALDASTSTNEFSEADIDGDGLLEDEFGGDDSIWQAQVLAARQFVASLPRLPGNRRGERIRVAVLTFAGDDALHLHEPDRDFEPTVLSILSLAHRDAELHVPLSGDYAQVDRELAALTRVTPSGMTDFAAAIGRAIIELEGLAAMGAEQRPREGARRVVDFLTDGMPSLPYDREEAERAARFAARLAGDAGIRINVFEVGKNAVTRRTSETSQRMADVSDGALVVVQRPADIGKALAATSLGFVDRVRLENHTTDRRTRYVATAIDGSFYGEVPLREGANEIEVVAVLQDGREKSLTFDVEYRAGLPTPELEAQLSRLREDNQALIDQIKARLAAEMRQRKQLEVGAGPED